MRVQSHKISELIDNDNISCAMIVQWEKRECPIVHHVVTGFVFFIFFIFYRTSWENTKSWPHSFGPAAEQQPIYLIGL